MRALERGEGGQALAVAFAERGMEPDVGGKLSNYEDVSTASHSLRTERSTPMKDQRIEGGNKKQ